MVTGSAGLSGFDFWRPLAEAFDVVGIDAMTNCVNVKLKETHHTILQKSNRFTAHIVDIENFGTVSWIFEEVRP